MKDELLKATKIKNFYNKYFPYIFTIIFLSLSIILISHHEFWRDEVHHWNIARDSSSIPELFYFMRQSEGHPYLWNIILYFISHFISENIESMKIIHLIFSTSTVFLILKFSPFNKIIKVLLIFSYFFFYEYSIISRNYALGILLIIIFCILYKNKYKNILPISITLLLMCSCNIYSFMISVLFSILFLFDLIKDRKKEVKNINKLKLITSIIIIIIGIVLVYFQIGNQLLENQFSKGITSTNLFTDYLKKIVSWPKIILGTYLPIPELKREFWNSNLIINLFLYKNYITIFIAFLLVAISTFLLKNKFKILFLSGCFVFLNFIILIYYGYLRHCGHIFIFLIACIWLSKNEDDNRKFYSSKFFKVLLNTFLSIVLIVSIFSSSIAFYYDYKYPFSNSKKSADYINNNFDLNKTMIIGIPCTTTETITGYLNKPFYYPQEKRFGTNVLWDNKKNITIEDIFLEIEKLILKNREKDILIIKDNYSTVSSLLSSNLLLLNGFLSEQKFSGSIVIDESYELFTLNKNFDKKLLKKLNLNKFESCWQNINNCKIESINKNKVQIISETDDPNFESNFLIPKTSDNKKLLLKIEIESIGYSEMTLYYRRIGSNYNEQDKSTNILNPGENIIVFEILNPGSIERIRLDPVNTKTDFAIKSIEFYELTE